MQNRSGTATLGRGAGDHGEARAVGGVEAVAALGPGPVQRVAGREAGAGQRLPVVEAPSG